MRRQPITPNRFATAPLHYGMTLIEVLVVIAIIGLLVGIAIPAVQASRSASRRLQCASNQRQLIVAITNYHDGFGVFPPLAGWTSANGCLPETPISRLFPYIEQRSLCDVLQANINRLPLLECPSDSDIGVLSTPLSYPVNASAGIGSGSKFQAPFDLIGLVSARDIHDGMSNTAGISENIVVRASGIAGDADRNPVRYGWSVTVPPVSSSTLTNPTSPAALAERSAQADISIDECVNGPRSFLSLPFPTGGQWGPGQFGGGWTYSHWYPPNSPSCSATTRGMDTLLFLLNNRRSASRHSGGVNVAFMDGHQRFVSSQIDQSVWRAAGTRNGNEVTGE